ncbi:MAG: NlpC/P60 family protein, partial [Granulosicoccaceae bacterium]
MMRVALQMRGKPYRYSGATPAGFDASGLVYYSYKEVGLIAPREFRAQFEQSRPVPKDRIRPGD